MLITKQLNIGYSYRTKSYYEKLGYIMPKNQGDKFLVNVEHLPKNSREKVEYLCESCNNIFVTKYSTFLDSKNGFCKKCQTSINAKVGAHKRRGENSYNWNSALGYKERIEKRLLPEYRNWRECAYKEFKYSCQCCLDSKGGNLIAHHLNSWDINESDRFNPYNAVVLCEKCHKQFHKMYGYGKNTREQFQDFLLGCISNRNPSPVCKVFADL